ncbi:MAG: hypothetical protein V4858_12185 [Pseudomonadota bacterium]
MRSYNPDQKPLPREWLAIGEEERIQLVEKYHHAERIKLPSVRAHAAFHAIVENQIAEGMQAVERAMERLAKQGLSRHDCIHAVSWVLAQHLYEVVTTTDQDTPEVTTARYAAAVERIDAKTWLEQAGTE